MDEQLKRNANAATAATITRPIATAGEVFPDGSMIELIGGVPDGNPQLMLWDGAKETVGSVVEHNGRLYEPAPFDSTLLRELTLPTRCCPHGATREFLAETCKLVRNFAGLPERSASLVGRFVLCSCLVEAVQAAPALVLVGPDTMRGNQLVALLHCLCRHGLPMTGLTPLGLRSLPSGAGFTFLISQPTIGDKLEGMLHDASRRDQKIPYRGGLLDLFGAQVIHAESIRFGESLSLRSIQIPMIPTGAQLPVFEPDVQHRVTVDFQAKLLSFRRANLSDACKLQFDSWKFIFPMRELAHSIAVATPDDAELQAEVFDLLRDKDEEIRSGKWVESSAVAVESMLVACHESPEGVIYVGELAEIAQEILRRRGEDSTIDPGAFGKRLKLLGFGTEPRDAKGMKVRLTEEVCRRSRQLARDFGVPHMEDTAPTEPAGKGA
ncbi:MAG: hypothetical protein WBC04_10885 [Candidatus Acidiferrales bacterium]